MADPWAGLRNATTARIGLGRSGDAAPLQAVLALQLAHAKARDAVRAALDVPALQAALSPDWAPDWAPERTVVVRSQATDRGEYLRRPDLGRRLHPDCGALLAPAAGGVAYDAAFIIVDGLSATAVQRHAAPLLRECRALLPGWSLAPVVVATQGRVALGDEVGEALKARLCAVLIGERPGLSAPDSLGVYLTYEPRRGRRDSERNCISNIHAQGGMPYAVAAAKLAWLMRQARHRGLTGVALKDEMALPSWAGLQIPNRQAAEN